MAKAIGRKEFIKHKKGKKLTIREAIHANCYECMGDYEIGTSDCEIFKCPLYPWMPYNPNKFKKAVKFSEKRRANLKKNMEKVNADKQKNSSYNQF